MHEYFKIYGTDHYQKDHLFLIDPSSLRVLLYELTAPQQNLKVQPLGKQYENSCRSYIT